jgi:hypothetical protein
LNMQERGYGEPVVERGSTVGEAKAPGGASPLA